MSIDRLLSRIRRLPHRRVLYLPSCNDPALAHLQPLRVGLQHEYGRLRRIHWRNAERALPGESPWVLFQYTLSGGAVFEDAAGRRLLRPGQAFLVTIPSDTTYLLPHDAEWQWIWLALSGDLAVETTHRINQRGGCVFDLAPSTAAVQDVVGLYEAVLREERLTPFDATARAYHFLMDLLERVTVQEDELPAPVRRAMRLIADRLADPGLGLDRMAEEAGLSKYHFARLFRRSVGCGPGEALLEARLRRARDLLTHTHLPIKQISVEIGYGRVASFCAAFRRRFGCTPSSLRP